MSLASRPSALPTPAPRARSATAGSNRRPKHGPLVFALAFIGVATAASVGASGCDDTVGTGGAGGDTSSSSDASTTGSTTSTETGTTTSSTSSGGVLPLACMNVIDLADPGEVEGDTTGLADGVNSNCELAGAGELAYRFVANQTGILHVELDSVADLGIYARTECGALSSEIACSDAEPAGAQETLDVDVREGQEVFIFVDGYFSGEAGPFTLTARSAIPGCGDGIVFGEEECDPPDGVSCDGECKLLPETCDDGVDNDKNDLTDCEDTACLGDPACDFATFCANAIPLTGTSTIGTTVGAPSNFSAEEMCTGLSTPEKVYVYTPTVAGVLSLTLTSAADLGIYARTTCEVQGTEVGCIDDKPAGQVEQLALPVAPGFPLTIFIDGQDGHTGSYSLQSVLTPFTEVEPNDSRPQANTFIDPFTASIFPAYDADWIRVTVNTAGTDIVAEIQDVGDGGCAKKAIDSQIEILGPDGVTSLAFNDDLSASIYCSKATALNVAPGIYYIKAGASVQYAPSLTFIYKLKVTLQ